MSFILDALKKSESDRQRQSGPSLFEVKVTPPRRRLPIWAVAIAVLLGVNVIVISWMLLRHPASQQPAASPQSTTAAPPSRSPVEPPAVRQAIAPPGQGSAGSEQSGAVPAPSSGIATPQSSGAAAPSSSGAAPASSSGPAAPASSVAREGSSGPPSTSAGAGSGAESGAPPAAGDNPNDYAPAVESPSGSAAARNAGGDLPLYQQIVTSDGLPALHLDLHVFASRPQDRFAMINMHRVGEGDSLPSGVHVEAIRPDGVVLSYQGTRFLLPRN